MASWLAALCWCLLARAAFSETPPQSHWQKQHINSAAPCVAQLEPRRDVDEVYRAIVLGLSSGFIRVQVRADSGHTRAVSAVDTRWLSQNEVCIVRLDATAALTYRRAAVQRWPQRFARTNRFTAGCSPSVYWPLPAGRRRFQRRHYSFHTVKCSCA